jgi:hypothetical protein
MTENDFSVSPLWAGYYEPDDVHEIVRWEVPEATVRAALDQIGWDDDHYFSLPVGAVSSEWTRGKLYAAVATLPNGTELSGYVGEAHDYLVVFVGGEQRVLSTRYPEIGEALPVPIQITNRVTEERWVLAAA